MTDHHQLLREYVQNGSETAFRELVRRYLNFVYSTALRLMDGDTHLAEDVTQTVFLDFARNARKLSSETLGGWLHRDTCFVASKLRRSEQRRKAREQEAVHMSSLQHESEANIDQLGPILDEAINQLGNDDRQAIILRFYEQLDFRSVGATLGSNEDAARMRVKRALEKLQGILKRQGVTVSAAALGAGLASGTVNAAPTGLLASISSVALAGVDSSAATATFIQGVSMTKVKLLLAAPLMVAGIAGTLWFQSQGALEEKKEQLRLQNQEIARMQAENQELSGLLVNNSSSNDPQRELLKLRGEVGVLKRQLAEASRPQVELPDLEDLQLTEPEKQFMTGMLRQQYLMRMKAQHAKEWMLAFHIYATDHDGQFPKNFSEAAAYLRKPVLDENGIPTDTLFLATNDFTIIYNGPLTPQSNESVVFMTSSEMDIPGDPSGGWTRIYALADGSVQRVHRKDGNFDDWEKEHLPSELTQAPPE